MHSKVLELPPVDAKTTAGLANLIIVYADLIATGDPRNLETAQLLRDEYITEPHWTAWRRKVLQAMIFSTSILQDKLVAKLRSSLY